MQIQLNETEKNQLGLHRLKLRQKTSFVIVHNEKELNIIQVIQS